MKKNWRRCVRQLIHWAVTIALLLHLVALVFMDQSFLPGPLP